MSAPLEVNVIPGDPVEQESFVEQCLLTRSSQDLPEKEEINIRRRSNGNADVFPPAQAVQNERPFVGETIVENPCFEQGPWVDSGGRHTLVLSTRNKEVGIGEENSTKADNNASTKEDILDEDTIVGVDESIASFRQSVRIRQSINMLKEALSTPIAVESKATDRVSPLARLKSCAILQKVLMHPSIFFSFTFSQHTITFQVHKLRTLGRLRRVIAFTPTALLTFNAKAPPRGLNTVRNRALQRSRRSPLALQPTPAVVALWTRALTVANLESAAVYELTGTCLSCELAMSAFCLISPAPGLEEYKLLGAVTNIYTYDTILAADQVLPH
jgi:hypothetical protein